MIPLQVMAEESILDRIKKRISGDDKTKKVKSKKGEKKVKKEIKDLAPLKKDKKPKSKAEIIASVKESMAATKPRKKPKKTVQTAGIKKEHETDIIVNGTLFTPLMVSKFDELISAGGIEKGNNIMISGGTGSGKSTFALQALYHRALKGLKGVYISFEEKTDNLKRHMKSNYGWDFDTLEKKGFIKFIQMDPFGISRRVESELAKERGELLIKIKGVVDIVPKGFDPDLIVVDSLSALSAAFLDDIESYRLYVVSFLKQLTGLGSINIVIGETEQEPNKYSRTGIEEFLVDGVIVLYNIRSQQVRQRALEILKLRCSNHVKKLIPYKMTDNGIEIYPDGKIFI